ncbi:MAG: hypothetical protein RL063_1674, partial [Pseudomonadota bacterium]
DLIKGFGPLAHAWLEQRTHNPLVLCSTHRGATNIQSASRAITLEAVFNCSLILQLLN